MDVEMHQPVVITDGGPWAIHDHACSVCSKNKSVLDLNTGIYQPCWTCQRAGWAVIRKSRWRTKWSRYVRVAKYPTIR